LAQSAFRVVMVIALLLAPTVAFAHPGHGETADLLGGFLHPFGGLDHLLAMTAVGLIAAQIGGRALVLVPASFVALMALGGLYGAAGGSLPFVETAVALSVLAFGALIASGAAPTVVAAMTLVGAFALFHGHAHGVEMPAVGSGVQYGLGFVAATALLHGAGIGLGLALRQMSEAPRRRAMQTCGLTLALVGAGLTIGLI
jgi:urease accessory protein